MPFDPNPIPLPTTTEPTIEEFAAWVARQEPGKAYKLGDAFACALAQFGFPNINSANCERRGIPDRVYVAAITSPATFGALSTRLSHLIEEGAR